MIKAMTVESKSASKSAQEIKRDKAGKNKSMSKAVTVEKFKSKRPLQVNIDKAVNTNTARTIRNPLYSIGFVKMMVSGS